MNALGADIRLAVRRLAKSPGYSLGILLALTLGLALSVGMYTVLRGVVLQGLPYPGGEHVVEVSTYNVEQNAMSEQLTPAEAFALAEADVFEHVGWFMWGGETVLTGDRPREITVQRVSAGFFPALGLHPRVGRWIAAEDLGPDGGVAILSDEEWERLFARNPGVVGQPLTLADETLTIIGVMPPEFSTGAGLWLAANPEALTGNPAAFVNARYLHAVAKLREGVEAATAARALDVLSARIRETHRLPDHGWRLETTSLLDLAIGDVRGVLAGVFLVSLVVLAIACANVGSLVAARLATRERELAIVQALGATPGRVWRSLLLELSLLAMAAGVMALLLLTAGLETFRRYATGTLPRADELKLEPSIALFAAGLAVSCVLLIALPFGLRLKRRMGRNLQAGGKGTGDMHRGSMRLLPVGGLALATTALIAGTAVAMSLDRLRTIDPGFRTADIYAVQLFHGGGSEEWRRFAAAVLSRIRAEPDVESVALTTAPPLSLIGGFSVDVQVTGRERPEALQAGLRRVTEDYLEVMSQPLLVGRGLLSTDDTASPMVALVNESFVRRVFGSDTEVVGREINLPLSNGPRVPFRIVGVVADIRNAGLRSPADPEILIPFMQSPWVGMTFMVHAPRAGAGLLERMQEAVWAVDSEEAMTRVYRLQDEIDAQLAQVIFFTRALGGFALLALLLATFGTYSVFAFLQRRQTPETGIRLALGAQPLAIARRVLLQGLVLAALAGLTGSLAAVGLLRLLAAQLYGIGAGHPVLYAMGIGAVGLAALAASAAPAWRAARIQPMRALRYE